MTTIIGVKFRHQCKCYYFDPRGQEFKRGDAVIVETSQGIEYAQVVVPNTEIEEEKIPGELRAIVRAADEDDEDQLALNKRNEFDAVRICRKKIAEHGLEMKLIRAEYAFDRTKLTFFFTADGRVDFRELVKDLAGIFRTRIELRQVGVRDETRLLGGVGICGRELCCATWLTDFVPVSIKMAKEQNLSLNSAKISGICGRLMCCLKNEEDTYEYLNAKMPDINSRVRTSDGLFGTVSSVNVLKQEVSVLFTGERDEDKEIRTYRVDELSFAPGKRARKNGIVTEEELEQLDPEILKEQDGPKPAGKKHQNGQDRDNAQDGNGRKPRGDKNDRGPRPEKRKNNNGENNNAKPERPEKKRRKPAEKTKPENA